MPARICQPALLRKALLAGNSLQSGIMYKIQFDKLMVNKNMKIQKRNIEYQYELILIIMFGIFGLVRNSQAAINITLPYSNDFDESSDLSNISWNENGTGGIVHNQSDGWQEGCVEITPPTTGQTHVGIGAFNGITTENIYVRMLVKVGNTLASTHVDEGYGPQNKFLIISRTGGDNGNNNSRAMAILEDTPGLLAFYAWQACSPDNDGCAYDDGTTRNTDTSSGQHIKFPPSDEWVCIQLHAQVGGSTTITETLQNGTSYTFSGTSNNTAGGFWSSVYVIGGYWNGGHTEDPNNHIYIDKLVIDDEPIGIPTGFTGGDTTSPASPSGLSVS